MGQAGYITESQEGGSPFNSMERAKHGVNGTHVLGVCLQREEGGFRRLDIITAFGEELSKKGRVCVSGQQTGFRFLLR